MKQKKVILMGILALLIMFSSVNIFAVESKDTKVITPKAVAVYPTTIESIFKDSELASAIAKTINKQPSDTIERNDLSSIVHLNLRSKNIESLEGIDELYNVSSINASGNSISDLSNVDWSRLYKLSFLNLDNNNITDISNTNLNAVYTMYSMSFANNKITSLDNVNFNGFNSLKELTFTGNQISSLANVDFSGLNAVYKLVFIRNNITNFDNVDWTGANNIEYMTFADNQIDSLDNASWKGLDKLKELNLSSNKLTDLSAAKWPTITTLNSLDLTSNQVVNFVDSNFTGLSNLKSLYFADNQVTTIDGMDWTPLISLTGMSLANNEIVDVRNANLDQLTNLTGLSLLNNKLGSLTKINFDDISKIERISFAGNEISELNTVDWTKLPNLTSLNLDYNKITDLKQLDFNQVSNLTVLSLTGNQISSLEGVDFDLLPKLGSLSMYAQSFTLEKTSFRNQVNAQNIFIDFDGSNCAPSYISNDGVYDEATNSVNWNLSDNVNELYFHCSKTITKSNGMMVGFYTGSITIPFTSTYQITFKDWDETIISQERLLEGEVIVKPADPIREGYTFNGWLNIDQVMPANDVEYIASYTKINDPSVLNVPAYTEIMQHTDFDLKTDVEAFDGSGNDITNEVVIDKANFDFNKPGFYTINYSVTDADNNTTKAKRLILVNDGTYVSGDKFIIQATDFTVGINDVDTSFDVLYNSAQVKVYDKTTGTLVKENVIITSLGGLAKVEGVYQLTFAIANELDTKITINAVVISDANLIVEKETKTTTNNNKSTSTTTKETSIVKVETLPTTGNSSMYNILQLATFSILLTTSYILRKTK